MKTITKKFLQENNACKSGLIYAEKQGLLNMPLDIIINHAIETNKKEKLQWANWLIVRCMNKKQKIQYAIFSAELVLHIFEKKHTDDNRPRKAIKAAKEYLKKPSKKTKAAAYAAAAAAADAYAAAAYAAADAAYAAAAAAAAADAADAAAAYAAYAADAAADAAAADAAAAYNDLLIKILKYGLDLLNKK